MPASASRRAAYRALLRVSETDSYVDEVLNGPSFERLEARDRALATEIVLGTLRTRGILDAMLGQCISRPLSKLDAEVLASLRLGAYQLRFLDRIPDRAAVSESVELVKRGPKRSAAPLVNAALRRLPDRPARERRCELALPEWLVKRWKTHYGEKAFFAMSEASLARPATYLRLDDSADPGALAERLAHEGVSTEATEFPHTRRLVSGRPTETTSWSDGLVRIQDIGAQQIAPLLRLTPESTLLDLCAAPGGKAAHAASIRGSARGIVAGDRHVGRLRRIQELAPASFDLVALDAETALPFRTRFDRVLADVPCSGTGTLRHNPDIKWRLQPSDIPALVERQRRILTTALDAAVPDGVVVYATCSLEPEENQGVVDSVLAERPRWRVSETLERIPGRDSGDGFYAAQITAA